MNQIVAVLLKIMMNQIVAVLLNDYLLFYDWLFTVLQGPPWSSGKDISLIPRHFSSPVSVGSNHARSNVTVWESQFTCGRSVVSSQIHCICIWVLSSTNKNWPPSYNWKLLSMAKNDKQTHKKCTVLCPAQEFFTYIETLLYYMYLYVKIRIPV
jgi:hypothetical protein